MKRPAKNEPRVLTPLQAAAQIEKILGRLCSFTEAGLAITLAIAGSPMRIDIAQVNIRRILEQKTPIDPESR